MCLGRLFVAEDGSRQMALKVTLYEFPLEVAKILFGALGTVPLERAAGGGEVELTDAG